jgi:hypothetical protein
LVAVHRVSPLCAVLCAVAATSALPPAAAAAQADPAPRLKSPALAEISRGPTAIADRVLTTRTTRFLSTASSWGGPTTASTGETVTVLVSSTYPVDPAIAQRWADFLAGLVHGSELSSLTAYLAPLDEVQRMCGADALACYDPARSYLVAPGDDPAADTSAEAVVAHEYGHHVAAHRSNPPWNAVDYGTKRWATYEQVCPKTTAGLLYPGAEDSRRYELNPGEAFAETYRVLNERREGLPETEWGIVTQSLYPDATALALLEQDVTSPWQASTLSTRTATLTKASGVRAYTVATPLDGTIRVTVRAPQKSRFAVAVTASGRRVASGTATNAGLALSATVCGERTYRVQVSRVSGAGTFRLQLSTP